LSAWWQKRTEKGFTLLIRDNSRRLPSQVHRFDRISLESGVTLPCYGNFSLSSGAAVTRAVVVVHDINRNAQDYFESIDRAAADIGVAENTIIVAPCFQIEKDGREDHDAFWSKHSALGWGVSGRAV
jgi:hypothetical protein